MPALPYRRLLSWSPPPASVIALLVIATLAIAGCGRSKPTPVAPEPVTPQAVTSPVPTLSGPVSSPPAPASAVKLLVDQPGLYHVPATALQAAGFDLQSVDPAELSLTAGGEPVAFVLDRDPAPGITFFGQPRDSRYGHENVYWLGRAMPDVASPGPAQPRAIASGTAAPGDPLRTFSEVRHLEQQNHYLSQTPPGTEHWLWEPIYAPGSVTVPFDLPGWAGGDASLSVVLWGNTLDHNVDPDHRVILRVNGQEVGTQAWDGKTWQTATATVPAALLRETGNELVVEAPNDTGALVDVIYLDRMVAAYTRQLQAGDGRLIFTAEPGQPIEVAGLESADVLLWDVTDPGASQPLSGYQVTSGTLRFDEPAAGGPRTYAVATRPALLAPQAIAPATSVDLRDNPQGADYVAVVHPDFIAALQPLVDYRRSQGLRVAVASIQDVYDTFSHGLPDPTAIRDYMAYARQHWPGPAPRFLLLVGDATYDYQGFVPGGTPSYVPAYLLSTHFVGETASDNWFVSLEGADDLPDMAVGRIPAQTPEQVATVVAKTLGYENAAISDDWLRRALFVADNKQDEFQSMSDAVADQILPPAYQVQKVYLGQTPDASAEILSSLQDGVGLVNYVGHGSMNVWAQEKIFQTGDVAGLSNSQALPLMVTMTCLVGYFHHPQATSMGEELLFKPDGGVVAALVPTSETLAADQRFLAEGFYQHLYGGALTVGEAIMQAKQDLPSDRAIMQDLIETFTLLGDPALRLQQPAQ